MGLFSKGPKKLVPGEILSQLRAFGQASWDAKVSGRSVDDPRFSWTAFFSKVSSALRANPAQAIAEIDSAAGDDALARFGGYSLISEFDASNEDPRYLGMMDHALQMMYERRLSSGHLSRYEADRWVATHGDLRTSFDRIVDVAPSAPPPSTAPVSPEPAANGPALQLNPGDALMVAKMGPNQLDNEFWIERGADKSFSAFSMRPADSDATALTRYSEESIGRWETADGVLRSLGGYLRSPTFWAQEQLDPYFVERRLP